MQKYTNYIKYGAKCHSSLCIFVILGVQKHDFTQFFLYVSLKYCNFATENKTPIMKEIQFSAIILLSLLTVTLTTLLPWKVTKTAVLNRSRWLLAGSTALLAVQFLLQYAIGFRQMGTTQAVMVNLLFFVPASWLFSMSLLNMLRKGQTPRHDWMIGLTAWGLTILLITIAMIQTGDALSDSQPMRIAEYIAGIGYCLMQFYYNYRLYSNYRRLRNALNDYYDHDIDNLLFWMRRSIYLLIIIAASAPLLIFSSDILLMSYTLIILFSIYYTVYSFVCYCISNDSLQVEMVQQNANEEEAKAPARKDAPVVSETDLDRVSQSVKEWLASGGHLHSGITVATSATEMHVPQRLLRAWYRKEGFESYSDWLQQLRVGHAKKLLAEHPDWSLDTIAEQSGFSSRNYFHRIFLKLTGQTPSQYSSAFKN